MYDIMKPKLKPSYFNSKIPVLYELIAKKVYFCQIPEKPTNNLKIN